MILSLFYDHIPYRVVRDGDPTALYLANRHYSRKWKGNLNSRRFRGAGESLILLGVDGTWLFVWRHAKYRRDHQEGVECAIFRNESARLSSDVILECEAAWDTLKRPLRKYTYVKPDAIKSTNPGYCFQKAGWTLSDHISTRGLRLLYKEVEDK